MERRVSLITLASDDLDRVAAFYGALGWEVTDRNDQILVYDLPGQSLGFYRKADLARDMGLEPEALGTGACTLGHNVATVPEVTEVMDRARAAGARILKEPHKVFWGGTIGYFADPDGHIWEVAHNPFSPLSPEGAFRWDGYAESG